jgi:hypothetical protein
MQTGATMTGKMGAEILSEDVERGVAAFLGISAFLAGTD